MNTDEVLEMLTRRQKGRSLREFAAEIGCSAAFLSDLYRGNRIPGPKIMEFLGLTKNRTVEVQYAKKR